MFKRINRWIKGDNDHTNVTKERKRVVKEWISSFGINWCDIENLVFWKDPWISLAVFGIFTLFFW